MKKSTGTGGSFSRVKLPGREVKHPTPSGAEFKNELNYKSATLFVCMAWTRKLLPCNNIKYLRHIIVDHFLFTYALSRVLIISV
jgi:hypothetical protein